MNIISFQQNLIKQLPKIIGNADYNYFRLLFEKIDKILISGAERPLIEVMIKSFLINPNQSKPPSPKYLAHLHKNAVTAVRCVIALKILDESNRKFCVRLADSEVLRNFCRVDDATGIHIPSKSTIQRYRKVFSGADVVKAIENLTLSSIDTEWVKKIGMDHKLSLENIYLDSTCIEANVHFPVDWVLLRDSVRTIIKSIIVIRNSGLKSRIDKPENFISTINKLSIEMTHAAKEEGSSKRNKKKYRKMILRKMKKVADCVSGHGLRYRDLLLENYEKTDLSEGEVNQIVNRINNVLDKLPLAIHVAYERIIGERIVPNNKKLLSLYQDHIHVYVRDKAGKKNEFGNKLLIAEQEDGLIIDHELIKNKIISDTKLIKPCVTRIKKISNKIKINSLSSDRGFSSKWNDEYLIEEKIENNICPRSPKQCAKKMTNKRFKNAQKRRASTEARIGILKNVFLTKSKMRKLFTARESDVALAVLVHNLSVIARIAIKSNLKKPKAA